MAEEDGIRVFLSTPESMEPKPGHDIKQRRRQRRKKPLEIPPLVRYKSVYEQTDLTRLTERQRLMALKFRANVQNASRLFLAVNELGGSPLTRIADTRDRKWMKRREKMSAPGKPAQEGVSKRDKTSLTFQLPFYSAISCNKCENAAGDILEFTNWLLKRHKCKLTTEIKAARNSIAYLVGKERCICHGEAVYYYELIRLSESQACNCI